MADFFVIGVVASSGSGGGGSSPLLSYGLLFVLLIGMYFVLVRPGRKRQQERREMQSQLGVGDEVITTSGIYGFIADEDDTTFWLLIDDEVEMRVARAAIQSKVDTSKDSDDADSADGSTDTSASDTAGGDADTPGRKTAKKSNGGSGKKTAPKNAKGAGPDGDVEAGSGKGERK